MDNNKIQKTLLIIGGIVLIIIIAVLVKTDVDNYNNAINNIHMRFADEMSECWKSVGETGGSCELEIIYQDNGQTPVSAKVVRNKQ